MGFGVWGLGIGDWGLGIGPNPQSPIPNPQSPIPILIFLKLCKFTFIFFINYSFIILNKFFINKFKHIFYNFLKCTFFSKSCPTVVSALTATKLLQFVNKLSFTRSPLSTNEDKLIFFKFKQSLNI